MTTEVTTATAPAYWAGSLPRRNRASHALRPLQSQRGRLSEQLFIVHCKMAQIAEPAFKRDLCDRGVTVGLHEHLVRVPQSNLFNKFHWRIAAVLLKRIEYAAGA